MSQRNGHTASSRGGADGLTNSAIAMDNYGSTDETTTFANSEYLDGDEDEGVPVEFSVRKANDDPGTYFNDGKRKIDFVIVLEEEKLSEKQKQKKAREEQERIEKNLPPEEDESVQQEAWRKKFLDNLRRYGLEIELDVAESDKKTITYYKLHAPWSVLEFFAEELNFRAPLQIYSGTASDLPGADAHTNPSSNWSARMLKKVHIPNIMQNNVPNKPLDFFTCTFKRSKLHKFLGSENKETFFSNTERTRVVNEILQSCTYGKRRRAEIGIDRLLEEDVFQAAYPLHDGTEELPKGNLVSDEDLNKRQILYKYWARWGCWYKYQPLDHIREYFGEKIGIYFAWLGFYTGWLLPSSVVGVLVFLYGMITVNFNVPARELCDSGGEFKMCPLCDEEIGCTFWNLSDTCMQAEVAYLFDHPGTLFFAIFMSFWAVSFLEYWKRKQASLAHHWDVMDFEEEEERPRPEFAAKAPMMEKNPITGIMEPYFPEDLRKKRWLTGVGILCGMVVLVLIFMVGVIMYRVLIDIPLSQNALLRNESQSIASMSSAVVNLILIMVLGQVYQTLAGILNDWEMHRTQTEHEDNLTFKVFIFQFMNFFSSIFYIAFFKGKFVGYPGNYTKIFGLRNEACSNGGCLVELAQQLLVIMVGKQIINNCQEVAIPKLKQCWLRYKLRGSLGDRESKRWEADYQLVPNEGLFEEYLEMVIQFGFITVFVAAFPLAPLFALLNNWIEIRLDGSKYVCEVRRSVADRAQDIGIWYNILEFIANLAVISNAFLIAFTSELLPRLMYQYQYRFDMKGYVNFTLAYAPNGSTSEPCRYKDFRDPEGNHTIFYYQLLAVKLAFVIIFEHFVFGIGRFIDFAVPDVPETLEIKIKREAYLAKQALQEIQADENPSKLTPNLTVQAD
ncbi:anoctamin-7-like isoform X1 [Acanthaster planci]|uniref:Anoctamin n=2 Tax=Acanthaster planci TaxID=133434 RepID=A0A8B7YWN8_ACAPL|nr:anoctamin-7-like isoform X1 [Acanthaster planci]